MAILSSKRTKQVLALTGLFIVGLLILHVVNYARLDLGDFDESAQALLGRSRQIREQARPEYQDETLAALAPNQKNGAFSRLDDLLSKAVVIEAPNIPPQTDTSDVLLGFEFDDPVKPGLKTAEGRSTTRVENGVLRIEHRSSAYLASDVPIRIPRDNVADIIIRARADKGTVMSLGWNTAPTGSWKPAMHIDFIADDSFRTYVINAKNALRRFVRTGEEIREVLLQPSNMDGAVVEIDFIRFISKRAKYRASPHGTDYETIGKELRRVLYMLPAQALEYTLRIPEGSPTLDFGTAVLMDNEPVSFEVAISDSHRTMIVYSELLTDASEWHDARLDLSRWAGRQVQLSLRVAGSQSNVAFWSNPLLSSPPRERFNVIVILEDALRADHLSTYGHALPTSPAKDRLMAEAGIVFLNAISQATKTRPSVPTLMTSLLPTATGVWNHFGMLSDKFLTIAEIMRRQGFVTASYVQNDNAGQVAGLHQGFSQYFDEATIGQPTEEILGARVAAWLERHRDRNFFLYLHVADPHGVYDPPPPYDEWYREVPSDGSTVKPDPALDPAWLKHPTPESRQLLYDGEIRHNDAQIEKFLEKLKTLGIYDNTLIVFVSDHGEYLGEHGFWEHQPPGYLAVIGVPIMVLFPARYGEPARIPQTVQLIDVMPTILELAEVDSSQLLMQGDSLVDLIEGRRLPYWNDRISVSEEPMAMSKGNAYVCGSLFFRKWQLISSKKLWSEPFWRLPIPLRLKIFNFKNDGDEDRPVYSFVPDLYVKYRFANVVSELQSNNIGAWEKWTAGDDRETYIQDPDALERLRNLGYVR